MEIKDIKQNPLFKDPKIGKVIEIPDNKSLIINLGSKNSKINIGDSISVYEEGPEIKFEEKIIGRLDFIKETLEIVERYEYFSLCKKIVTKTQQSPMASMASLMNPREVKEFKDINVNPLEVKSWRISNPIIGINDPIKLKGEF